MSLYDNENKIIEAFQAEFEEKICMLPNTHDVYHILTSIYNKENWIKWNNSSKKNDPPPDFYNDELKIMMDVMRIDDHAFKNEKGKIINPTLQKENELYNKIINSDFIKSIKFKGNIIVTTKTELPSEEDHNYGYYLKNFIRVINKHNDKVSLYNSNHPNFKVIFFIFDESSAYFENENKKTIKKIGDNVKGKIHYWFLDKEFVDVIINANIDYLIWYSPYKHYIGTNDEMIPRICIYDVKKLKTDILLKYDESKMDSVEI